MVKREKGKVVTRYLEEERTRVVGPAMKGTRRGELVTYNERKKITIGKKEKIGREHSIVITGKHIVEEGEGIARKIMYGEGRLLNNYVCKYENKNKHKKRQKKKGWKGEMLRDDNKREGICVFGLS